MTKQNRIELIDSYRGFALLGVCLAHMFEQYFGNIPPTSFTEAVNSSPVDSLIGIGYSSLIVGKFYLIFSFLFGISFSLQIDNPVSGKQVHIQIFLKRLFILALFGLVHMLFYRGDILIIYALLGFLLVSLKTFSNKSLLIIAIAILILPRFLLVFVGDNSLLGFPGYQQGSVQLDNYFEIIRSGSLLDVFIINFQEGFDSISKAQFGILARGYSTFAMFIFGILCGRLNFFQNPSEYKHQLTKLMIISISCLPLIGLGFFVIFPSLGKDITLTTFTEAFALILYDGFNISIAFIYSFIFIHFSQKKFSKRVYPLLANYGRMALTNYVLQSILGTMLFYGWGLGLIGEVTNSEVLLIAPSLILAQIIFSSLWLRKFKNGPLEWLWRSLTKGKLLSLKSQ